MFKRSPHPGYLRRLKKQLVLVTVVVSLFVAVVTIGFYGLSQLGINSPLVEPEDKVSESRLVFSPSGGEYRLDNPQMSDFSRGQSKVIDGLLGAKVNGFFVDLGAGDGETNSVSLFFEKNRSWSGVLVDADETKHRLAVAKNRKSQIWNFRIRLDNEETVTSELKGNIRPDRELKGNIRPDRLFQMINHTSIDLLIINLRGMEFELLKHIDLAKYSIRVITIELQNDVSEERYAAITDLLTSRGYTVVHHLINSLVGKKDVVYMKS